MPSMDGIAFALATGKSHPDVAIMLTTGFADQRERARGLGVQSRRARRDNKIA